MTVVGMVATTGVFYYHTQKDRNPGSQIPFEGNKKTVVVLGSGWGATSFLKGLDTDDYNVVCRFAYNVRFLLVHSLLDCHQSEKLFPLYASVTQRSGWNA